MVAAVLTCWLVPGPSFPVIASNEVCSTTAQSLAMQPVTAAVSSIDFDWVPKGPEGYEAAAVLAQANPDGTSSVYLFGVDGGTVFPNRPMRISKLVMDGVTPYPVQVFTSTAILSREFVVGSLYHTRATFDAAGNVQLVITENGAAFGSLTSNVPGGVAFNYAGFSVGRGYGDITCMDNLVIA